MKQIKQNKFIPQYARWECPNCGGDNCTNDWGIGVILACHRCGEEFEIVKPEEKKE